MQKPLGHYIFLILLPRGIPGKYLALIFLAPLFFNTPPPLPEGQVRLTVLDVGQGLSAVVQTRQHVLIYDTGAKYSADYDMGTAVVIPFLQSYHIRRIDNIIISHGDNDHIGGLQSILKAYPTDSVLTSVPEHITYYSSPTLCLRGQHWVWDGVQFDILYPDKTAVGLDNNSSCVLRITTGNTHILLTGDIEKPAEEYLLNTAPTQLSATILIAPHHGSITSSSPGFVQAVHPQFVVFPTGYLNRFHFPSKIVVQRYQESLAKLYNTADGGAISFLIEPDRPVSPPTSYCYSMNLKYLRYCPASSSL